MAAGRPVIFGEVLFDCFEEEAVLGGAPFNVAWHLHGFGLNPLFISRVGKDELGDRVLGSMERWGMDTTGLQQDSDRPTGRVEVKVDAGQPRYEILPDQAYDFIDQCAVSVIREHSDLAQLYHGTLALRNEVSEATLIAIRDERRLPVFVDVNLRPPWWDLSKVSEILPGTTCIKLNEGELRLLERQSPESDSQTRAAQFKEAHGAEVVLVTQGEAGAFAVTREVTCGTGAHPVDKLVDTVGAGDGFSAVAIAGILKRWPWEKTLDRAATFAAWICGYRGAIREDRGFYEKALEAWRDG
jgi:fructokinase